MKTELTRKEEIALKRAIKKYLLSKPFDSRLKNDCFKNVCSISELEQLCGLPYTSSGCYAGFFVCNIELYFDIERKYTIYGFGMSREGKPFVDVHCIENGLETFYLSL